MKSRGWICCVAFAAIAARAYWAPTSIEQLAANSDCVVMGRVTQLVPNTNTHRVLVTMQELTVLKGSNYVGTNVMFDAPFTMYCDTTVTFNGQQQFFLNSFAIDDSCAVFLKTSASNRPPLGMTDDCDGKFTIDPESQIAWRSVTAKGQDSVSLAEFARLVKTSRLPSNRIVVVAPTAPTAIVTNLIPTNLPIQLILPRAITR